MSQQTSWLGSTGECGVPQNQVGEHSAQSLMFAVHNLDQIELPPDDTVNRAVKQKVLLILSILYCLHCAMPTDTGCQD